MSNGSSIAAGVNHDDHHAGIVANIPAFVLGGLDAGEASAMRTHLENCEECRQELARLAPLPDALNLAVPEVALPEGARERLLARVAAGAPLPPLQLAEHRRRAQGRWSYWALGAAAVVILLLGATTLLTWQENRDLEDRVRELDTLAAMRGNTIADVVDLMERADLEVKALPEAESGARTRVYEASEGDVGMIVFDNLPPLGPDQEYQLWASRDGQFQSIGTFTPSGRNSAYHKLLRPPEGFAGYDMIVVAPVPKGGVPAPPSEDEWTLAGEL